MLLDVRGFECFSNWSYGKNFKWICSIRITLFLIWIIQFGYIFCIILICIHMLPNMSISILICNECVKLQRFQKMCANVDVFCVICWQKTALYARKGTVTCSYVLIYRWAHLQFEDQRNCIRFIKRSCIQSIQIHTLLIHIWLQENRSLTHKRHTYNLSA